MEPWFVLGKGSPVHPWFPSLQLALMPDKLCLSAGDSLGKITSPAVSLAVNLINLEASQQLNISKPQTVNSSAGTLWKQSSRPLRSLQNEIWVLFTLFLIAGITEDWCLPGNRFVRELPGGCPRWYHFQWHSWNNLLSTQVLSQINAEPCVLPGPGSQTGNFLDTFIVISDFLTFIACWKQICSSMGRDVALEEWLSSSICHRLTESVALSPTAQTWRFQVWKLLQTRKTAHGVVLSTKWSIFVLFIPGMVLQAGQPQCKCWIMGKHTTNSLQFCHKKKNFIDYSNSSLGSILTLHRHQIL